MPRATLPEFDPGTLTHAVGKSSFARGFQYARQQAVLHAEWNPQDRALHGLVRGSAGNIYVTTAFFAPSGALPLKFIDGECSCPVGFNCKHAVALILSTMPALVRQAEPREPAAQWRRSLDSLLASGQAGGLAHRAMVDLAIELTLAARASYGHQADRAAGAPFRLLARLVRPGKNGGWINGGLSWGKLDSLAYTGDYQPAQVRLLTQLHALYSSCGSYSTYYGHAYGDDRSIDLSAFDSRQLWPLLDEAGSVGLALVYPRKLGIVGSYRAAELCLDITGDAATGALVIVPAISVEGTPADVVPVTFIGKDGHGVVYADRAEISRGGDSAGWRFRLAKLARPAAQELQRLALAGQRLEVPAAEAARFRGEYYPQLRRAAAVISSDGSFVPPVITGPQLVLRACYGPAHDLDLSWEWGYQVGDAQTRIPVGDASAVGGFRDLDAERSLVDGLDQGLAEFGLLGQEKAGQRARPGLVPSTRLTGIDTMRFSTELLPLLRDQPGLLVEVTGEPADYREAGDSLRIAVATDAVAGDMDWFDLGVTITVEGRQVPFLDVFLALSRGEQYLLLADGAYFSLGKPELQALARLIAEARALQEAPPGELRISRYQAGLWDELAALGVVDRQAAAWREQVRGLLAPDVARGFEPPAGLRAQLRPYQQAGFSWLAFLWQHQLGGILADDMGLGKTLQALALICHAKQSRPSCPPFLIVAPTSVVPNWAAEAARFTPGLRVVPVSETETRRGIGLRELVCGADAVVTSYTLLRLEFDAYAGLDWSGLLLDEAQNVKNRQSKAHQCVRRLPAPVKVAMTGTPLENNLMELWSLLSVSAPGLFPNPAKFGDYYARPIEKNGDAELLAQLQRRIKPLVKRRTKQQVIADLPAKQEQVLEVDLHPQHRRVYQTHLQRERQKILGLIADMNANRFTIFRSLTLLRQLSLHAGLVDDAHADLPSSKVDVLLSQLSEVAAGSHRALVFSQFTGFLGKIRRRLDAEGLAYCYLDGKTRDRAAVIDNFKAGAAPVFLISLKAGGFGLNLTEADYCFLMDPWWNPATEAQAVDRTHRIGQTRNVMVYRLVARETIEEKVMALKARKAELFASVLDQGGVFSSTLDADDIRGLIG